MFGNRNFKSEVGKTGNTLILLDKLMRQFNAIRFYLLLCPNNFYFYPCSTEIIQKLFNRAAEETRERNVMQISHSIEH